MKRLAIQLSHELEVPRHDDLQADDRNQASCRDRLTLTETVLSSHYCSDFQDTRHLARCLIPIVFSCWSEPVPVFQQTAIAGGLPGVTRLDRPAGGSRQARNDSTVDASPLPAIKRKTSHCHRVGRVGAGFRKIIRHRRRSSPNDPSDPQSNFRISSPHAPPRPRVIAIF